MSTDVDAVCGAAWTTDHHSRRKLTPERPYGRRKTTAHLRLTTVPRAVVAESNELDTITNDVIEAAASILVIGAS